MELEPVPKQVFMAAFPRYEPLIKDSTAIVTAKTCFRKYFYRIVLGRVPGNTAPWLTFGGAYHKFREHLELEYNKLLKEGKTKEDACLFSFQPALKAGVDNLDKRHVTPPAGTQWDFFTKDRFTKSCKEAWKHWVIEKKQNKIEVIAIEQAFNVQLRDGSSTSGRFDQIIRWNGKLWGRDFKTTSKEGAYYSRTLEPNDQFTRYTLSESLLCGEPVQGQIIEVLYNSKSKGPLISVYTTTRTPEQLKKWEDELIFFHQLLAMCREQDNWPMMDNYYQCSHCDYHSVCKKPNEAAQMAQLRNEYKLEPWDNTRIGVED